MIPSVNDVVQPDIVVVGDPAQVSDRGIEGAPFLAIEIVSPSTGTRDRTVKAHRYAALGVRHYWIVDPDTRRVEFYGAEGGRYGLVAEAEGDAAIVHPDWPDFALKLADLWR